MAAIESQLENLKLTEPPLKAKGDMLQAQKSNKDGKLSQSGEDDVDSVPSKKPQLVTDLLKGMGGVQPTLEDQPMEQEKRDEEVETRGQEDSPDAVPLSHPTVPMTAAQLPNVPQKTRSRPPPTAAPIPVTNQGGGIPVAEETAVEQVVNLRKEKDLLLYEIAERVAGICDLRKVALRLRITESEVARTEHDFPMLINQFNQVFQMFVMREIHLEEAFQRLLEVLVKADQGSTAVWLRKRLGIRESIASLEGESSSPIVDVAPQREESRGSRSNDFYDIFLMHSGTSDSTKKFQRICRRHNWVVKASNTIPAASPVHDAIERILVTSTHLALIITESDCIKYRKHEMSMTVEMALQLAYTHGELSGRVLPIRCCEKRSLPLVLQALTGAHIDEDSFEERLVETIDTTKRLERLREHQD